MTMNDMSPLADVTSCRSVEEHHDPVESEGVPFHPGDMLDGRFLITEVVSRSGMGCIFKAKDTHKGEALVAVKVPHLEYESDPLFFSRFQREAALLAFDIFE